MSTKRKQTLSRERRRHGSTKGKRWAQAMATRQQLIDTGRNLFAEKGYHATSTPEIVAQSGVTQGALYHHFADKEDLFLAVFMEVQRDVSKISLGTIPPIADADPWTIFRKGSSAFLHAVVGHKDLQRILLLDGPVVLGWKRWREIQQSYGLGTISDAVSKAIAAEILPPLQVTPLAHMILAMFDEAALLIVNGEDRPAAIEQIAATVDALLRGIAIPQNPRPKSSRLGNKKSKGVGRK